MSGALARATAALCALALGLALGVAPGADASRILFTKKSLYRNIMVSDEDDRICLTFRLQNGQVHALQSCMYKSDHDKLVFEYSKAVMAGLLVVPDPKRILVLGLGGGSIPRVLRKLHPEATIEVVEIDEAVVQTAAQWFDFKEGGNVKIHVKDGRQFVKQAGVFGQRWDIVVLDAFNGDYIPEHMMTKEFLEECKRILAPDGVLVANTFSSSKLYDSESATYAAVFGAFVNVKKEDGNRIILAQAGPPKSLQQLKDAARTQGSALRPYDVDYAKVLDAVRTRPDWDLKARVLTDEWNPANVLRGR